MIPLLTQCDFVFPIAASVWPFRSYRGRAQLRAPARTAPVNRLGFSQAAKCPPRAGWFQYTVLVKRRSAQRRDGRGTSLGKTLHPAGTVTMCRRRW